MLKPLTKIIVVDLDGTLCNDTHRKYHLDAKDWDAYHLASKDDEPWEDVLDTMNILDLSNKTTFVACTGRNEEYRDITMDWFNRFDVPIDLLLMRPNGNYQPDHELKPALLSDHFGLSHGELREHVLFILEDRDKVVDAWRALGHRCWQVQPGGF